MEPESAHIPGLLRSRARPVRMKRMASKGSRGYGEKEEKEGKEREENGRKGGRRVKLSIDCIGYSVTH